MGPGHTVGIEVIVDKASYKPGESARVTLSVSGGGGEAKGRLELSLVHIGELVARWEQQVSAPGDFIFEVTPPPAPLRGYGLDAVFYGEEGVIVGKGSGALDVLERWSQAPRYGFLSDFAPEQETSVEARCDSLRRYHLNVVQYYDWMWRHYRLMPPEDEFTDALGRKLSLRTVRAAIEGVQARGGATMAYGAVYGAEPEYADRHPELRLYDAEGKPVSLAELFFIMNISPGSPWVDLIVAEFAEAVRVMSFDGIHLDQYGFPRSAYDATGETVDLSVCFPPLIDRSRKAVVDERPGAGVIFNAVENWPIETVAPTTQDAVYIEVWPPYTSYNDLRELISRGKQLGRNKQVILAAYLSPFGEADEQTVEQAEAAALLATAVITASGGFHLLLGERDGVLCDPYYPKYATMRPAFIPRMRAYYDFLVRYEELFILPELEEWACEVRLERTAVSSRAEPGKVWAITRSKPGYRVAHLINLVEQKDYSWNALRIPPRTLESEEIELSDAPDVKQMLFVTPEEPRARPLEWRREGSTVRAMLPPWSVWGVIICMVEGS